MSLVTSVRSKITETLLAMENKTFFYFAYGSNLLTERIRINNPSARAKGIGVLKDYKLDFNNKSKVNKNDPNLVNL